MRKVIIHFGLDGHYLNHQDMHIQVCTKIQGGSNMTGTDLYVNKPHCAAAVRP